MTPKTPRDRAADYLMSRIDWERAKSIPYAERTFRLDRMRRLLALLDDPHESLKIVHVAGTKGKGSTTVMLATILHAAGFKTGAFTSPHLERIEERFTIDGHQCPGETFAELIEQIEPAVATVDEAMPGDGPTYFEIATAVALLYFAREKVDVAVLEVGLGGRLDSTNVCNPLVSILTSISFDHTQQLGTTLAQIATEKAGIIKPGVPVVSGVLAPEAQTVIRETCQSQNTTLLELETDFHIELDQSDHATFHYRDATATYQGLKLKMLGRHQARNASLAIATVHELVRQGWAIDESAIRSGLTSAQCPARIEVFDGPPRVVIDSAHNGASIESLIETLDYALPARRRHLLFSSSEEKDLPAMLRPLIRAFDRIIFTRYTINPRAIDPNQLNQMSERLTPFPAKLTVIENPSRAFQELRAETMPDELLCVTGSFFIAAEIRRHLVDTES